MVKENEPSTRIGRVEAGEYSSRGNFYREFSSFVNRMESLQQAVEEDNVGHVNRYLISLQLQFEQVQSDFNEDETGLFETAFNHIRRMHGLPPFDDFASSEAALYTSPGFPEFIVQMGGSTGISKTQLAEFLAPETGSVMVTQKFTEKDNPFLSRAYEDPGFMLRAQLRFLLDSVSDDMGLKLHEERWVSDTSVWSDIYVFMEWRKERGLVTEEEYGVYIRLVNLLEPLIVKPDLLVMMVPTSLDRLQEGIANRMKDNMEERSMESAITEEDLRIVVEASEQAVNTLKDKRINVLRMEVDPVEMYRDPSIKYASIHDIRGQLGILNEYLTRSPESAAEEVMSILASGNSPQFVLVFSESMFTAKTFTSRRVTEMFKEGEKRVLVVQPEAALRYGPEHENHMMDRDGGMVPAFTFEDNRLSSVAEYVEREVKEGRLSPNTTPCVMIDELMLFIGSSKEEAIESIERINKMGFHVVGNGITRTFQEEPFTFMFPLLENAKDKGDWHHIQMGTRCKYCREDAMGTRRILSNGKIAPYDNTAFMAGDEDYEPVCCGNHKSCVDQPGNFDRQILPI